MIGDKTIRIGEKLPRQYQKMVRVVCDFSSVKYTDCGATFWIIHENQTADIIRAHKQARELMRVLRAEHTPQADLDVHQKTYELDD